MKRMRWRPYAAAFILRARLETQYRLAALGGLVTQAFFGLVLICLYTALFDGEDPAMLRETVSYVWLQQMFFRMLLATDGELEEMIVSGGIAYAMVRPVDQHAWWLARDVAARLTGSLMRLLPMLLFQLLLPAGLRLAPPESPAALAQFFVSLLLGAACLGEISGIREAVVMMTLDRRGAAAMINLVQMFLAGNIIPLTLFPDRFQAFIRFQPFAQALDAPVRMYLHAQPAPAWLLSLCVQLAWILLLAALGRRMWARRFERMTVQGG